MLLQKILHKKKLHIIIFLLHFQKHDFILPHIAPKANQPPSSKTPSFMLKLNLLNLE
jgi:hypothetical protein